MISLAGKAALITGGSRGIGAAAVKLFAQAGADVVFNYNKAKEPALQIEQEARKHGTRVEAFKADVGKHADKLWAWAELPVAEVAAKLELLRGIGPWTIGSVMASALADPDAVAVGDFHLKNVVAFNLAGEARGTDERMLELLAPYAGQRGRVIRLLLLDGHRPPSFGPRKRILPMARW